MRPNHSSRCPGLCSASPERSPEFLGTCASAGCSQRALWYDNLGWLRATSLQYRFRDCVCQFHALGHYQRPAAYCAHTVSQSWGIVEREYTIPSLPRKLLANLWARGTIVQCYHNQSSVDLFGVAYFGSVQPDAILDPELLSGFVVQVKSRTAGATSSETELQPPIGIPRDPDQPLPYLTLLMELGYESSFQGTQSKIGVTISPQLPDGEFRKRCEGYSRAMADLSEHRRKMPSRDPESIKKLTEDVDQKREAMNDGNRYSIFVRGASPSTYGILNKAEIVDEFATLLKITTPSPSAHSHTVQHMCPMEGLDEEGHHMAWMSDLPLQ